MNTFYDMKLTWNQILHFSGNNIPTPEAAIKSSSEASFNVGGEALAANSNAHSDHDPCKGPVLVENHAQGTACIPVNCGPKCDQKCQPEETPQKECEAQPTHPPPTLTKPHGTGPTHTLPHKTGNTPTHPRTTPHAPTPTAPHPLSLIHI